MNWCLLPSLRALFPGAMSDPSIAHNNTSNNTTTTSLQHDGGSSNEPTGYIVPPTAVGGEATTVSITSTIFAKLIDCVDSMAMYMKYPERCYLMDPAHFPEFADDEDNCVYMSGLLYNHYNNINTIDDVATFALRYVRPTLPETGEGNNNATVEVVFRHSEACAKLHSLFREHSPSEPPCDCRFLITLEVGNLANFQRYLQYREYETYLSWRAVWEGDPSLFPYSVDIDLTSYPEPRQRAPRLTTENVRILCWLKDV